MTKPYEETWGNVGPEIFREVGKTGGIIIASFEDPSPDDLNDVLRAQLAACAPEMARVAQPACR